MTNKWVWKMDWCKSKGLAPSDISCWMLAEDAYYEEIKPVELEVDKKSLDYLEPDNSMPTELIHLLEGKSTSNPQGTHSIVTFTLPLELIEEFSEISAEKNLSLKDYIQSVLEDSLAASK